VLELPDVEALLRRHPRAVVLAAVRAELDAARSSIAGGGDVPALEHLSARIAGRVHEATLPGVRRCVNGTGIILHTALGRAPFAAAAQEALAAALQNYCTIAIDLTTGKRGDRHAHVAGLLRQLTGAEAALVVNNNCAATLLILNTLAEGREVVVSRGELVEIGGSFRIPEVMARSGAALVEVGTTNRTHLKDYRGALTDRTALIMKVHQSNYRIEGFTSQVPIGELVALGRERNVPVVDDVGSGALIDLSRWGLPREPLVRASIEAGADVVCFSGDKLVGGPQCGVIVGKKPVIDRLKANQLMRALRCDKLTYVVLEATLRLFLDEEWLRTHHPVVSMLAMPEAEIRKRCLKLRRALTPLLAPGDELELLRETSEVGSGSLAAVPLPTWAVGLRLKGMETETLAARLRAVEVPVIGRVKDDRLLLDGRTIRDDEIPLIAAAIKRAYGV